MGERNLRRRQRAFRETEIALATARLLARVDCQSLTMDQVAEALETSKASLYRLFTRETLLRRALEESIREALVEVREAAERGDHSDRLRLGARALVERWLALASPPDGFPAPCCLREVDCPYTDWSEAHRLLKDLASTSDGTALGFRGMDLARALRALAAVRMHQLRASGRRPTRADTEAILRYLLPGVPARPSRRRRSR